MLRLRIGLASVVVVFATGLLLAGFTGGGGVAGALPVPPFPGGSIETVCAGTPSGTTFTLTANCGPTTAPITVPATIQTVDGGSFMISATDIGFPQWSGGILTNSGPGQTMNIKNLTLSGPTAGFQLCTNSTNVLYGIWFDDAGGSVDHVTIDHLFQFQNGAFGSCQTGRAIRADGVSAARTVNITNTTVMDYQKSGFEARDLGAPMTMNVSTSTAGPPHPLRGLIAQNAVSYVGASGTVANNTIIGSGNQTPGVGGPANGTAVLLFGANHVTVDHNVITGAGTDIGVAVSASSTNITVSFNQIGRTAPVPPDPTGHGVDVAWPTSQATLICNTFTDWNTNILGAVQIDCTPLPPGTECKAYSAPALTAEGGTLPYDWSASGTLPPGLSMSSAGVITGTPTAGGTFNFTAKLVDSTAPPITATQGQTITIASATCGTPPVTPPTTSPPTGTQPEVVTSTTPPPPAVTPATLPVTGGAPRTAPLVAIALFATGTSLTGLARRRRNRKGADRRCPL
jgi:hypothetical protein